MISRRALLLTGAALGVGALSACGSSGPAVAPTQLPSYAGQGGTKAFDGTWIGQGLSDWRFDVKDGAFTGAGAGRGLSSWTGAMSGFIRADHGVEGVATSSSNPAQVKVTGTWPLLIINWPGGPSQVRAAKA